MWVANVFCIAAELFNVRYALEGSKYSGLFLPTM
jgi:hypothetical protein